METRIAVFALVAAIIMFGRKLLIEYLQLQEKHGGKYSIKNIWKRVKFDIRYFFSNKHKK